MKKILVFISVALLSILFIERLAIKDFFYKISQPTLPKAQSVEEFVPKIISMKSDETVEYLLPSSINLEVPFTIQAPHQNWDLPYQEACEEASLIMVDYFYKSKKLTPATADSEIKKLVEWQNNEIGDYKDTNALQNVEIINRYFGYSKVDLLFDFTSDDIRRELAEGRPVLLPMAGRELKNPYYTAPGPIYHMLVVKGYTEDGQFITNDPGTRKGADYIYNKIDLLKANHDWNNGDVINGKKVMIVIYPN